MLGYWNRPAETEAVLRDGWYVTGDIAVMDADGFIKIVDRQSRFSKIAGEMVPHGKVEEVLQSLTLGASCVVTAVADERRGERLVAFVTSRENDLRTDLAATHGFRITEALDPQARRYPAGGKLADARHRQSRSACSEANGADRVV